MKNKITPFLKSVSVAIFGILLSSSMYSQVVLTTTQADPICAANCDASITCTATGGAGGYEYSVDGGISFLPTPTFSGLCAGSYSVIARDSMLVSDSIIVNLVDPPALIVTVGTITNESFSGACDGSGDVIASGGTAPYVYNWAPAGVTTATATALCYGNQSVTITDANGCVDSVFVFIDSVSNPCAGFAISAFPVMNESSSGACDGVATSSVTGGTAPYTFNWSSGSAMDSAFALCGGSYSVTITDFNGCTDSTFVNIMTDSASCAGFNLNIGTVNNESFSGACDGYADVFTNGGTAPFNFNWSSGSIIQSDSNLCYGNYNVTVTDFNGCADSVFVFIDSVSNPCAGFAISAFPVMNESSSGACDGIATSSVTGGTAPYTFNWSSGSMVDSAFSLCGGNYSVTITDANGCTDSVFVNIMTDSASCAGYSVNISPVSNETSAGACDGNATVNTNGGTAPFTYSWSNGSTTATAAGLCSGSYSVSVTDFNGCADSSFVNVLTDSTVCGVIIIDSNAVITAATCFGQDGSITGITISGGIAPYTYQWSGGSSSNNSTLNLTSASPGTAWILTVTDSTGCPSSSQSLNIGQQNSTLVVTVTTTNASCFGTFDGQATATVTGGTAPYNFQWHNGAGNVANNPGVAGTGWVQVTDANGCTSNQELFTINEPSSIVITETITAENCGSSDGSISLSVSGGISPYTYSWSQGSLSGVTNNATGLASGLYEVTIVDANGCYETGAFSVANNSFSVTETSALPTCSGGNDGMIDITVTPAASYTYLWSNGDISEDASNLEGGFYSVTISNGTCQLVYSTLLNGSFPIDLSASSAIDASGCNSSDGSINVVGSGGSGSLSYELYGDLGFMGAGASYSALFPGAYIIFATDMNGCVDSSFINVSGTSGTPINIILDNVSSATCSGTNQTLPSDGIANITVSGGASPYQFYWRKYTGTQTLMSTTEDPTNLSSGNYTLEVLDQAGCSEYMSLVVPGSNLAPQSICLVTVGVDSANNQENIVVWEKALGLGIDRYEIWREELNGFWQKRGTVLYSQLSQFTDNGVDPNAVSYKYRLKTIDECNNVSVFQAEHRSIQLSFDNYVAGTSTQDGTIDLAWNAYVGINNLTDYIVERIIYVNGQTTTLDVTTIPVVSGQMNYSFTDNTIPEFGPNTSLFYTIRVDLTQTCSATKAQDHNTTRSNRASIVEEGGFPTETAVEENNELTFKVYPNPSSGVFNINLGGDANSSFIRIYNPLGKLVYNSTITSGYNTLNLGYLQNGLYYMEIESNGLKTIESIVIQK